MSWIVRNQVILQGEVVIRDYFHKTENWEE